jgi:hypothetical protein
VSTPIDLVAVIDRYWTRNDLPEDLLLAREAAAGLIAELAKAHAIIRVALNAIPAGEAKTAFCRDVQAAGLDGDGITRANERELLLARVGVAS